MQQPEMIGVHHGKVHPDHLWGCHTKREMHGRLPGSFRLIHDDVAGPLPGRDPVNVPHHVVALGPYQAVCAAGLQRVDGRMKTSDNQIAMGTKMRQLEPKRIISIHAPDVQGQ